MKKKKKNWPFSLSSAFANDQYWNILLRNCEKIHIFEFEPHQGNFLATGVILYNLRCSKTKSTILKAPCNKWQHAIHGKWRREQDSSCCPSVACISSSLGKVSVWKATKSELVPWTTVDIIGNCRDVHLTNAHTALVIYKQDNVYHITSTHHVDACESVATVQFHPLQKTVK